MNQVYSRPAYYDRSWKGMREGLAFAKHTDTSPKPDTILTVEQMKDLIPREWDDSIRSFLPFWMDNLDASLEEIFALYSHEFNGCDSKTGDFFFGYPEENNEEQFLPLFKLTSHDADDMRRISLEAGYDGMLSGDSVLIAQPSTENTFTTIPDVETDGKVAYNVANFFYAQKLLELLALDVGRLLTRGEHLNREPQGMEELMEMLQEMGDDKSDNKVFAKRAAAATFPRNYSHLRDMFAQTLQIRMVLVMNICALTDDPQDAFDWLTSIDSPVFCGPDAANLSIIADQVYPEGYPNFFRLRGDEEE